MWVFLNLNLRICCKDVISLFFKEYKIYFKHKIMKCEEALKNTFIYES